MCVTSFLQDTEKEVRKQVDEAIAKAKVRSRLLFNLFDCLTILMFAKVTFFSINLDANGHYLQLHF